jgi:hypothetical protein
MMPNQALKNTMSNNSLMRRTSSADLFGNFHPIELSSKKNSNFMNGKPNANMDMRVPMKSPSSAGSILAAGIDKSLFQPSSPSRRFNKNKNNIDNTSMPPMTQSMSNISTSRRVSVCSSSVISDDSSHSVKVSSSAIINAATNIVNGTDFESFYNMNDNMNDNMNKNMNNNMSNSMSNNMSNNMNNSMSNNMNNIMSNNMNNDMSNNTNNDINNMNSNMMHTMTSNHINMDASLGNNISNVVSEPGPYDIVCGRNSGAYNYIGNRRFRVTIEMNLQRYIDSPTREDKTNVIKSIVWMLHEQVGARFLKKETFKKSSGSRKRGTPRYTVMTDKQAREKVGHALRDLVITARKEQQEQQKKQLTSKDVVHQC